MVSAIRRRSKSKLVCTIEEYNAGKDPFRIVARGLPHPWPCRYGCCSMKISSLLDNAKSARIDNRIMEILRKYKVSSSGFSTRRISRTGYYGHGKDAWVIWCTGDDPFNYKAAALEVQQVMIAAGIPEDFNVEFVNPKHTYCDESYGVPDNSSLIGAIEEIQQKLLHAVREQLPNIWTSVAYHMRGKKGCCPEEMKPTVIVFCKPNSKLNWREAEAKIALTLRSKKHPDLALHLELLPGQVERATPPLVTHGNDHPVVGYALELSEQPKNENSIGINTDEEPKTACTLGGWVELAFPDGRSVKCILTTYDIVRNGDQHNRALNDYNGIGLDGQLPLSSIQVIYPAPMDIETSRRYIQAIARQKNGPPIDESGSLALLEQLSERGIGHVVHASSRRVDPGDNRNLDWALIDSPSTFQRNLAPVFDQSRGPYPWEYKVKEWDLIKSISSYRPGERVTHRGRSSWGHGQVGRLQRRVRWDDGEESYEDEVFGEISQSGLPTMFADRGDVGSWIVNNKGELVGVLSAMDIWTGSLTHSAFVTPIQTIIEDIEKRTGGKISLP